MIELQKLREMPLFAGLPEERMQWLCENIKDVRVAADEVLVGEGDSSKGFYILLEGEFAITKFTDGQRIPAGRHVPPSFFGEIPLLADVPVPVTVKAVRDSRLVRLSDSAFRELLACCDSFSRIIFRTMAARIAGMESFVRTREKMAALGTLSAGLAHELNNPAAAVGRAADRMQEALDVLHASVCAISREAIPRETMAALAALSKRPVGGGQTYDALQVSEAEDTLTEWLEDHGIDKAWLVAPILAASQISIRELDQLAGSLSAEQLNAGINWLAATLELRSLMDESRRGSARISEIVKALKSYSYMDQGPQQEVDLHDGIEDTLTIMRHKLKQGITVERDYERNLPRLSVYGSELNQVWTNLIDNAADAMNGKGEITIRTRREGDYALVEIIDSGPGIPPEIQSRLFEPFFTTKPMGKGTGLGLDIAYRIVVNRHQGFIRALSRPGKTSFQVRLPLGNPQRSA